MRIERDRPDLRATAARVAEALFAELRSGAVHEIGIDVIRDKLRGESGLSEQDRDALEELTCRAVVSLEEGT